MSASKHWIKRIEIKVLMILIQILMIRKGRPRTIVEELSVDDLLLERSVELPSLIPAVVS